MDMQRVARSEYREHRARVNLAKSRIDCKPPSSFAHRQPKSKSSELNYPGTSSNSSFMRQIGAVASETKNTNHSMLRALRKAVKEISIAKKDDSRSNVDMVARQVAEAFQECHTDFSSEVNNQEDSGENLIKQKLDSDRAISESNTDRTEKANSECLMLKTANTSIRSAHKRKGRAKITYPIGPKTNCWANTLKINPRIERQRVKVLKFQKCDKLDHSIPNEILRYYERLTFYKEEHILRKLLRPVITLSISTKSKNYSRDLGVLTFQVYTEACPGLALELIRCCTAAEGHNRFDIIRIFDPKWIEGELEVEGVTDIATRLQRTDPKVIRHDIGPGVLSFMLQPSVTSVSHRLVIGFNISLSPLEIPYGQRIAIAILTSGKPVLREIKKFATNSGKPTDKILVTKCSVLN